MIGFLVNQGNAPHHRAFWPKSAGIDEAAHERVVLGSASAKRLLINTICGMSLSNSFLDFLSEGYSPHKKAQQPCSVICNLNLKQCQATSPAGSCDRHNHIMTIFFVMQPLSSHELRSALMPIQDPVTPAAVSSHLGGLSSTPHHLLDSPAARQEQPQQQRAITPGHCKADSPTPGDGEAKPGNVSPNAQQGLVSFSAQDKHISLCVSEPLPGAAGTAFDGVHFQRGSSIDTAMGQAEAALAAAASLAQSWLSSTTAKSASPSELSHVRSSPPQFPASLHMHCRCLCL